MLVLIMSAVGFVMLAGLAATTRGFTSITQLEAVLLAIACALSVVGLAGAVSMVLTFVLGALVLGLAGRLVFKR